MLICNGTINGVTYEDKAVPAKLIADKFGVPDISDGKPGMFQLIMGTNLIKVDRNNGGYAVTPAWKMDPTFTISTKEGSLTIRYAESSAPSRDGRRYTPRKVSLVRGIEFFSVDNTKIDLFVWTWLNPKNKTSPFARRPLYAHYDPEAAASAENKSLEAIFALQSEILSMNEADLRMRAAGLSYSIAGNRYDFRASVSLPIMQVRNILQKNLLNHRETFISAWKNAGSSLSGMVAMAEATGVLKRETTKSGVLWRYSDKFGGASICVAEVNAEPLQTLITELNASPYHITTIRNLLSDTSKSDNGTPPAKPAVKQVEAPAPPNPEEDAVNLKDLIAEAIDKGIVAFDEESGSINQLRTDGVKRKTLATSYSRNGWMDDLEAEMHNDPSITQTLIKALKKG